MTNITIDNYQLTADVYDILCKVKEQLTNGKLNSIRKQGANLLVTCPFHKDGQERRPSCGIDTNSGIFHCFTCGEKGQLDKFVGACFNSTTEFGKQWLIKNFSGKLIDSNIKLESIMLPKRKPLFQKNKAQDSGATDLSMYQDFHPYMVKRKLSRKICEEFSVKYDKTESCIVFPVWDKNGKYLFNTKRYILYKRFEIPSGVEKPVYLLNFILKNNITTVTVVESQINALYCWTLGYPAIALFGTGSKEQYEILKKTPIKRYILCFDGDIAGSAGINRFKANMPKNVFIDELNIPINKDINDLSAEEVHNLYLQLNK